jgi:hypothetical protein
MGNNLNPNEFHERLLRQQLREGETLDGIGLVGRNRTAAVTPERLLIIGPTKANGWELKSLPWRLVTSMSMEAPSHDLTASSRMHLHFEASVKASPRGGNPLHPPLAFPSADDPPLDPPGELTLTLAADAQPLTELLHARLANVLSTTIPDESSTALS